MMKRIVATLALGIAAVSFGEPTVRAYEAPWCAVISMGRDNSYWDCQYRSVEECVPHVVAGNRGFCNPNPAWNAAAERPKIRSKRHHRVQ
jgi:hypothetical protein